MQDKGNRSQPNEKMKRARKITSGFFGWIVAFVCAIIIVIFIRTFLFTIITVDGPSMNNLLVTNDRLFVTIVDLKLTGPKRFDVVVCSFPNSNKKFVKRVIALPGETIEVVDGDTYIDGKKLDDEFITLRGERDYPPLKVPEDHYMVLGDNRINSHDSLSMDVGPIQKSKIAGKARYIIWPYNRASAIQ